LNNCEAAKPVNTGRLRRTPRWACAWFLAAAWPFELSGDQGDVAQEVRVPLAFRETTFEVATLGLPFRHRQDPSLAGLRIPEGFEADGIVWGYLPLGERTFPFVWSPAAVRLGVDRDGDHRFDEPGDLLVSGVRRAGDQVFTNLALTLTNSMGIQRVAVDLELRDWSGDYVGGQLRLRSFYEGRLEAHGKAWHVGWIPVERVDQRGTVHDSFLWRPWEQRDDPLAAQRWQQVFPGGRSLFLEDTQYGIRLMPAGSEDSGLMQLAVKEEPAKLGILRIRGEYVDALGLSSSASGSVMVTRPGRELQVPVGAYQGVKVKLRAGDWEASGEFAESLAVREGDAVELRVGGPLTNQVSVTVRGTTLRLDYQLVGAGGRVYRLGEEDRGRPPGFAIYRGARKVASGSFEYG
jgi:hypothetical protein